MPRLLGGRRTRGRAMVEGTTIFSWEPHPTDDQFHSMTRSERRWRRGKRLESARQQRRAIHRAELRLRRERRVTQSS